MADRSYRPEIDGLRAVAVLPVILFHAGYGMFLGGYLGVDVFFVISGYLITGIIWHESNGGEFSYRRFYGHRARRILPALFAVLLVTGFFAYQWMLPSRIGGFAASALASLVFAANFYFWLTTNYFSPDATELPLLHLWSLGIEEQFYLFYPPLLVLLAKRWRTRAAWTLAVLALVSLLASEIASRFFALAGFYLLPFRAWELLVGGCLALSSARLDRVGPRSGSALALLGLALIVGPILWVTPAIRAPILSTFVPALGAALVLAFASQRNFCGQLLSLRPIRFVGLVSYSAYLWHQPVLSLMRVQPYGEVPHAKALAVVLSLVLAVLSWRLVERPFRRGRLSGHPFRTAGVGMALCATCAAALLTVQRAGPSTIPTYHRVHQVGPDLVRWAEQAVPSFACNGRLIADPRVASCHFGAQGPTKLLLWGDSYSHALLSGLDGEARARGLSGEAFFIDGCPPVVGEGRRGTGDLCAGHARILQALKREPNGATVVLFGNLAATSKSTPDMQIDGAPMTTRRVREKIAKARLALDAAGKRLILLEQGPWFDEEVADHYLTAAQRGSDAELFVTRAAQDARLAELRLVRNQVDDYVDTANFFCGAVQCPARDSARQIIFYDHDHLTEPYAHKLARMLLDRLTRGEAHRIGEFGSNRMSK